MKFDLIGKLSRCVWLGSQDDVAEVVLGRKSWNITKTRVSSSPRSVIGNMWRYTNPIFRLSEPASNACAVNFASLLLLFFSSVARTAARWVSSFCLQSTPLSLGSNSLRALMVRNETFPSFSYDLWANTFMPLDTLWTPSISQRATRTISSLSFHRWYRYATEATGSASSSDMKGFFSSNL